MDTSPTFPADLPRLGNLLSKGLTKNVPTLNF